MTIEEIFKTFHLLLLPYYIVVVEHFCRNFSFIIRIAMKQSTFSPKVKDLNPILNQSG